MIDQEKGLLFPLMIWGSLALPVHFFLCLSATLKNIMPSVSMSERVSQLPVFLNNNGSNKFSLVRLGLEFIKVGRDGRSRFFRPSPSGRVLRHESNGKGISG